MVVRLAGCEKLQVNETKLSCSAHIGGVQAATSVDVYAAPQADAEVPRMNTNEW